MIKTDQPLVSIIIVNTHEEKFILPLLESIQRVETELSFEIIIIDNDSDGRLEALLKKDFSYAGIISLKDNVGFCKANNAGLRKAKGKYVLLLNPDTLLHQPSISICIKYFEDHSEEKIGAIGCQLQSTDRSTQTSFFSLAGSIKKTLFANVIYLKLFSDGNKRLMQQCDVELHQENSNPPWLCGAFLLMNREVLTKEEFYLDEDFFLYSDDVELGYRIRSHGYKIVYYADTSIIHFGGGNRPFLKRFEQLTMSEWLCMMKIHSKFYFSMNQSLLLINLLLDEVFFQMAALRKKISIRDKREKIVRHKLLFLWKKVTFIILFKYQRKASSSQTMFQYKPLLQRN